MTTLTIEIDKERDLPALQVFLTKMNLNFRIEDEEGLPEAALLGIEAGLADIEAGRTHTHEFVMNEINHKINAFGTKNA